MTLLDRKLDDWKRKLLDLTRRNPALYFRSKRSANLEICAPPSENLIQSIVVDEVALQVYIPAVTFAPAPRDDAVAQVAPDNLEIYETALNYAAPQDQIAFAIRDGALIKRRLKAIYKAARADFEERAITTLYLAMGLLRWTDGESEQILSPLLLIPVILEQSSETDAYTISASEDEPIANPSLLAKLESSFRFSLPELPEDWEGSALTSWLDDVRAAVAPRGWSVDYGSWLGRFSFHKLSLYQDLEDNAEIIKDHAVIKALAGERFEDGADLGALPSEGDLDRDVRVEDSYLVLDADSSQLACIEAVSRGHNFVIQGPPGTGKSQTIVNLISQTIATGRTVLFVSEKIAALEVVYNRLQQSGLGSLCLELHSQKAKKREVIDALYTALRHPSPGNEGLSADEFHALSSHRDQLNAYADAINGTHGDYDVALSKLLGQLAALNDVPFVDSAADSDSYPLSRERLGKAIDLSRQLTRVWTVAQERLAHPWYGYAGPPYGLSTRTVAELALKTLAAEASALLTEIHRVSLQLDLRVPEHVTDARAIDAVANLVDHSPGVQPDWLLYSVSDIESQFAEWKRVLQQRADAEHRVLSRASLGIANVDDFSVASLKQKCEEIKKIGISDQSAEDILLDPNGTLEFLRTLRTAATDAATSVGEIFASLNFQYERSIEAARELAGAFDVLALGEGPEPEWFDKATHRQLQVGLEPLRLATEAYEDAKAELFDLYDPSILNLDIERLIERFSHEYKSMFRYFRSDYRIDSRKLSSISLKGELSKDVLVHLRAARRCLLLNSELAKDHQTTIEALGRRYVGHRTRFSEIQKSLDVVRTVRERIGQPSEQTIRVMSGLENDVQIRRAAQILGSRLEILAVQLAANEPISRDCIGYDSDSNSDINLDRLIERTSQAYNVIYLFQEYLRPVVALLQVPVTMDNVTVLAKDVDGYRLLIKSATEVGASIVSILDRSFLDEQGLPNWKKITEVLEWLKMRDCLPDEISDKLAQRMRSPADSQKVVSAVDELIGRYELALVTVFEWFEPVGGINGDTRRGLIGGSIVEVLEYATRLLNSLDRLQEWCDFEILRNIFLREGLKQLFAGMCSLSGAPGEQLALIAKKSLLQHFTDKCLRSSDLLDGFRGDYHARKVTEFAALDRKLVDVGGNRVRMRAGIKRPEQVVAFAGSETSVLLTEANKKKKHLPIRKHFARMPRLLQQLKPCLLMSPLSVSQYLDPRALQFDLVIFDEASQICSEDAVSAIYRSQHVVVCGDKQQLPPTDFFKESDADDETDAGDEDVATFESILAELESAGLPEKSLKWHYRSADESLIAFSNERFYRHSLVTFPNASAGEGGTAISFVHVPDGVYDRGGRRDNAVEAQRVAELVLKHFAETPHLSLGVVAFSKQQADAIEDRLEIIGKSAPSLGLQPGDERLSGLFVKNLERVQGDERDVIIFSVGYGKGRDGRLTMNFGPLNGDGGEKRLNVAVTRARRSVILVSSIRAGDMDLSATSRPGVLALHRYLDYAERGYAALDQTVAVADFDSPFEEDVAAEVRRLGYSVVPQVGVSSFRIDLGVLDPAQPGRFILGIECDGAMYHSAYTARERDRLRHEILTRKMGWRLHRIWSPDWIRQRKTELQRLERAIEHARDFPMAASSETELRRTNAAASHASNIAAATPIEILDGLSLEREWITDYVVGSIRRQPISLQFHEDGAMICLAEMALDVICTEFPVHRQVVATRVARRWGLLRVGARMSTAMNKAYSHLQRTQKVVIEADFLSPADSPACSSLRRPVDGDERTLRSIEHVSEGEIAFGVLRLLSDALSLEREQVVLQIARALGFDRTGTAIRERVNGVLDSLISIGKVVDDGSRLVYAGEK
jgi:very-short-patch-repair endonuclease